MYFNNKGEILSNTRLTVVYTRNEPLVPVCTRIAYPDRHVIYERQTTTSF